MFTRTSSLATLARSLNFTRRSSDASQFRQNETTPAQSLSRALVYQVQDFEAFTFDSPELALTAPLWRCFSTRTLLSTVAPRSIEPVLVTSHLPCHRYLTLGPKYLPVAAPLWAKLLPWSRQPVPESPGVTFEIPRATSSSFNPGHSAPATFYEDGPVKPSSS